MESPNNLLDRTILAQLVDEHRTNTLVYELERIITQAALKEKPLTHSEITTLEFATDIVRATARLLSDDQHIGKFTDDGVIVQHPIRERVLGSLFDCPISPPMEDHGVRGVYVINKDGTLTDTR